MQNILKITQNQKINYNFNANLNLKLHILVCKSGLLQVVGEKYSENLIRNKWLIYSVGYNSI